MPTGTPDRHPKSGSTPAKDSTHQRWFPGFGSSFEESDYEDGDRNSSTPKTQGRKRRKLRESLLRPGDGSRYNHLPLLMSERKARQRYLTKLMLRREQSAESPDSSGLPVEHGGDRLPTPETPSKVHDEANAKVEVPPIPGKFVDSRHISGMSTATVDYELTESQKQQMLQMSQTLKTIMKKLEEFPELGFPRPMDVRIHNLTYTANVAPASSKIKTVYNSSIIYNVIKFFKNIGKEKETDEAQGQVSKVILDRISLAFKPGRMYLLLGPPGSGKSTLLKAIAGRLSTKNGETLTGRVTYNGKSFENKSQFHIENSISFIDQLDRHAARLTVDETFEFAFQCKQGGTHMNWADFSGSAEELHAARLSEKRANAERLYVNTSLTFLGLSHVKDTFVGDTNVRGVSGGQRRRVTVGEMLFGSTSLFLADEISNGLDASSTFEMIQVWAQLSRNAQTTRVVSLLQPSPETVALFDEIILLSEGQLLYAGPVSQVEDYFAKLGYRAPAYMDVADFLQLLSTPADCQKLFNPPPEIAETQPTPYTATQLAELFRKSIYAEHIAEALKAPHQYVFKNNHKGVLKADGVQYLNDKRYMRKYANSLPRSIILNLKRNLTLWIRDRRVLIANAAKNIVMGASVGGVFFQTDDDQSIFGVLFQGMLFIMLGAMTVAPGFVDERVIYYKHADANFFSPYPFVIGKAVSKLPQVSVTTRWKYSTQSDLINSFLCRQQWIASLLELLCISWWASQTLLKTTLSLSRSLRLSVC